MKGLFFLLILCFAMVSFHQAHGSEIECVLIVRKDIDPGVKKIAQLEKKFPGVTILPTSDCLAAAKKNIARKKVVFVQILGSKNALGKAHKAIRKIGIPENSIKVSTVRKIEGIIAIFVDFSVGKKYQRKKFPFSSIIKRKDIFQEFETWAEAQRREDDHGTVIRTCDVIERELKMAIGCVRRYDENNSSPFQKSEYKKCLRDLKRLVPEAKAKCPHLKELIAEARALLYTSHDIRRTFSLLPVDPIPWLLMSSWDVDGNGNITHLDADNREAINKTEFLASTSLVGTNRVVVAGKNQDSRKLELISWEVSSNGNLARRGFVRDNTSFGLAEANTGRPWILSYPAITSLSANRVVVAMQDASNKLRLIAWDVDSDGDFTRRGEGRAGKIYCCLAITPLGKNRVVVAVLGASKKLKLIAWDVDSDGNFTRRGEGRAGKIFSGPVITSLWTNRVVVAMQDASKKLRLITWAVDSDGNFTRQGTGRAGKISGGPAIISLGRKYVVVAVRGTSGKLKLIAWEVGSSGSLTRRGESEAGKIFGSPAITSLSTSHVNATTNDPAIASLWANRVVVAVLRHRGVRRSGERRGFPYPPESLKLITWDLNGNGNLTRRGNIVTRIRGGAFSIISLGKTRVVTTVGTVVTR